MRLATLAAIAGIALAGLPASALTVEAKISTELQKKLDDDYGQREAKVLTDSLVSKLERTLANRANVDRVVVTIEDAKPNRPTMEQVKDKPGLDAIRSISLGGAKVTGIAYSASGQELARLDYDWYETDIRNIAAAGTWSDARYTFDRFATKLAGKIS
jgi:hypothetical protein